MYPHFVQNAIIFMLLLISEVCVLGASGIELFIFSKIQGKEKKEEKQLADIKKVEEVDTTLKYLGENKGVQEDK